MGKKEYECKVEVNDEAMAECGGTLIGSVDQGTSSTRFLLFGRCGGVVASGSMEHEQLYPEPGWHEHDPFELYDNVLTCVRAVLREAKGAAKVKAIGIANQRETVVAWNARTGRCYYNAIVWDDARTASYSSSIENVDEITKRTGLPISAYFAGSKVRWLLDNVSELRADWSDEREKPNVRFGTVDTWLIYQLTGQPRSPHEHHRLANKQGHFKTDVTNASRWLFMNLHTLQWDPFLIRSILTDASFPISALPQIQPSVTVFGTCTMPPLVGIPIAGVLGDQQAALFGQCAFRAGEAKCTYGTGLFLMMNTGKRNIVPSKHGLLTTVAYQLENDECCFALEGSVSHSGSTLQWLRDQIQILSNISESERLATTLNSNDGMYLVPAFSGLFAPYWRSDARACIVGMSTSHGKQHIVRAALEAIAYQARDVFDAMNADSGKVVSLKELRVDGGGTSNDFLMQFQSDIINLPVIKPTVMETTARGAAFAAGLTVGVWNDIDELHTLWREDKRFVPCMKPKERDLYWNEWKRAVTKSMDWITDEKAQEETTSSSSVDTNLTTNNNSLVSKCGTFLPSVCIMTTVFGMMVGFWIGQTRTK